MRSGIFSVRWPLAADPRLGLHGRWDRLVHDLLRRRDEGLVVRPCFAEQLLGRRGLHVEADVFQGRIRVVGDCEQVDHRQPVPIHLRKGVDLFHLVIS